MLITRSQFATRRIREVVANIIAIAASPDCRDDLECYLNSLPLKALHRALAIMYFGRGRSRRSYTRILEEIQESVGTHHSSVQKLIEKRNKLPGYLQDGLRKYDRRALDR